MRSTSEEKKMKITRFNRGYAMRVTENELAILRTMEAMTDEKALIARLTNGQRKSLSRRSRKSTIFYLDSDKRTKGEKECDLP